MRREDLMLGWALAFFIVSIIAGVLGFSGIAQGAATVAQVIFFLFLGLCLLMVLLGVAAARKIRRLF